MNVENHVWEAATEIFVLFLAVIYMPNLPLGKTLAEPLAEILTKMLELLSEPEAEMLACRDASKAETLVFVFVFTLLNQV